MTRLLHGSRVLVLALLLQLSPAMAADVAKPVDLRLPAQSLGSALRTLARQADIQILFSPLDVAGLKAPALRGRHSAREALGLLLSATQLEFELSSTDTVIVRSKRAQAPITASAATPNRSLSATRPVVVEYQLEEIFVTAQKREQRLQDVPTTVTVVSAAALHASSVTEVNQLSNLTPGIFINSDQTGRNSKVKIRGIGPDEQSNIRPSIGFFYNDIPLMTQLQGGQSVASDLDLGDLTRIEVLKGPQSTLFGESVSGGAIGFYNRRPVLTDGFNGRISVTLGDHDLSQLRVGFGAPLGEKFAFRIAAHKNRLTDQVVNTVDRSRRKLSSEGFSVQLLFEPTTDLRFILEHNHRVSEQHGGANDGMDVIEFGPQTMADAIAQGIVLTPADPFDRRVQMVNPFDEVLVDQLTSLHATWAIDDYWTLTSISGYQNNRDHFYGNGLLHGYNASNSVSVGFLAQGMQKIRYSTEEVRVNYAGDALNSMLGLFYSNYQAPQSRGDFAFVSDDGLGPLAQVVTVDRQMYSAFTHNSWKFTDAWELVFGARQTTERTSGLNGLVLDVGRYSGQPLDLDLFPRGKSDESAWGGTLKLLWHVNEMVSFYAGVDRGFRLGGINNLGQPNYDTEVALNLEAGVKGLFFDSRLRLNASAYRTRYDGYQVMSYDSDTFTFFTQNADATASGIEVEAQWAPTQRLEFGANVAFSDNKYDKYRGAVCDNYQNANGLCPDPATGLQDLSGKRLSQSPRLSGNATVQYGAPLGRTLLDWYVRGEMVYRGSSLSHPVGTDGDPLQQINSYLLLNGAFGLRSERGWELMVWAKNLTDENYFTNISRQPVGSETAYVHGRIGMERNLGVTLLYNF